MKIMHFGIFSLYFSKKILYYDNGKKNLNTLEEKMAKNNLTRNQLRRLPSYLHLLKNLSGSGMKYISCQTIASCLDLNKEQVRKDIALISSIDGIPNKGRDINLLIKDIETILGYDDTHNAFIVGVGSLGTAFMHYKGFENFGLKIICAFEKNPTMVDTKIDDKPVYDIEKLNGETLNELNAKIGIISVPATAAQEVTDKMVEAGVEAIWNFAPIKLVLPKDIIVSNMDLAASLAVLSHQLYLKKHKKESN